MYIRTKWFTIEKVVSEEIANEYSGTWYNCEEGEKIHSDFIAGEPKEHKWELCGGFYISCGSKFEKDCIFEDFKKFIDYYFNLVTLINPEDLVHIKCYGFIITNEGFKFINILDEVKLCQLV